MSDDRKVLPVRATLAEVRELDAAAKKAGIPRATFMLNASLVAARSKTPPPPPAPIRRAQHSHDRPFVPRPKSGK